MDDIFSAFRKCSLCIILSWILNLTFIHCFDLQISEFEIPGRKVFNLNHGKGFMYSIHSEDESGFSNSLLSINSSTGALFLNRGLNCANFYNPLFYQITSKRNSDLDSALFKTVIPLKIKFQGHNCPVPYYRKFGRRKYLDIYQVYIQKNFLNKCFSKNENIFSLVENTVFGNNLCKILDVNLETPNFSYHAANGAIITSKEICLKDDKMSVSANIIATCLETGYQTLPFHLNFFNKPDLEDEVPVKENVLQRLRRQTNVNHPPTFDQDTYTASVKEEQNPGLTVVTITASDPDNGDAGTLTYSMRAQSDQRSNDMFAIHPVTGAVNTTKVLNRELIPIHYFHVEATDNGRPSENDLALLIIKVQDVNDHKPVFDQNVYYQNLAENVQLGTTVITIRAKDDDEGDNADITYRILNPSGDNQAFMIDPSSGSITTKQVIDREVVEDYMLLVQAMDNADVTSRMSSTATVNIKVLDLNDNKPQFNQSSYKVSISEDHPYSADTVIATVYATDVDSGVNKDITYDIIGDTGNTFQLNRITGQLSLLKPLDYETLKEYVVNIRATDGGSPPQISTVTVTIDVKDINDNDPEFYSPPYRESVLENVPINSTVLFVAAHDADSNENGVIEYSITQKPANFPFRINPKNGEILVSTTLDRETVENYNFVVMAKDKGTPPRSVTTDVQITIRDVNDNKPNFTKKFYEATVQEDADITQQIVNVLATDADAGENALVTYSILSGDNQGMFRISPLNGEGLITLAKKLDFKVQSQYLLTVQATDSGGLFDTAQVKIMVQDTNQNRPEFQGTPYSFTVDENTAIGTSVFQVRAFDTDSGQNALVSYQLHETTNFAIHPNTGVITTRIQLDREEMQGITFVVTASDHGIPSLTATTDIQVQIGDINDNKPIFLQNSYTASVREDATVGTLVTQISATDKDIGKNAQVTYTFENGNSGNDAFEIDAGSGKIRTAQKLDRETVAVYNLKAYAKDAGIPSKSTPVNITVNIEDVNDNAPIFPEKTRDIFVQENTQIKSVIDKFSATDPDQGVNAIVDYELVNTLDYQSFQLDYKPGEMAELKNLVVFDYESSKKVYEIKVLATSVPYFNSMRIRIHVQDINDNRPKVEDFTIIFNNYAEKFITGVIGRVPAYDEDVNDKLQYEFTAGNEANFLKLNKTTGEITLDDRLNSDVPRNGTIEVKVSDGLYEDKAKCQLFVRFVSMEMLQNSVTIRLNNMTQTTFMSPLYKFFVDALANILNTEDRHIYIINIQNDTDVKAQILNVSVAVRKNDGSFNSAEYIQEQIYLQRVTLAELSMVEVLPFDDNDCVIEMCPYFDNCVSSLKFGSAEQFINSDSMFFRPIRPLKGYQCVCPPGFAGNSSAMCSIEVDLCYSNPCKNGGTCLKKEGGFTCNCAANFAGRNCEVNTQEKFDKLSCPKDLCKNGFPCVPLINGGFRCDGCQPPHYNQFCQLTTRRFPKGSYLTFPAMKSRNRFKMELRFATQVKNALLFYNGRFNEQHDFLALEIIDEQVQFSFSLGGNITYVNTNIQGGVSNGEWTWVSVDYLNRTATLTVGEDCDTGIIVKYGHRLSVEHRCAAQGTSILEQRCGNPSDSCYRLFDLTGPLQIGGLPKLQTQFQIQTRDFEGCIKDFHIDDLLLDLSQSVANVGTSPGCDPKNHFCIGDPCKNGGTCIEGYGTYICKCTDNKGGKDCTLDKSDGPKRLDGTGYLSYQSSSLPSPTIFNDWYNGISFRTRSKTGVLMHVVIAGGLSVVMQLEDGFIHYNYTDSNSEVGYVFDAVRVNDGQWHYFEVRWLKDSQELIQMLDYLHWTKIYTKVPVLSLQNKIIQQVVVGGERQGTGPVVNKFTGCVKHPLVGNKDFTSLTNPDVNNAIDGCNVPNPCLSNPCSNGASCTDEWEQYSCKCPIGTIGPECKDICHNYNPCENYATCRSPRSNLYGYSCECGELQMGKYCDEVLLQPCPDNWYGYPICGPCNCPDELGFSGYCGTTTRECRCKDNHYRPAGSDRCFPCNCYLKGSSSPSCHPTTGQCPCIASVTGRECNQCESPYAGIQIDKDKGEGCQVESVVCPRNYAGGVWWDKTQFGYARIRDCPHNAMGDAKRNCSHENLWGEPDFSNCTSRELTGKMTEILDIQSGKLKLNTFVSKTMMKSLATILKSAEFLFGQDLDIAYEVISTLLDYELKQNGLNLTSEQDGQYVQHLLDVLSIILDPQYSSDWNRLQTSDVLLYKMERYTEKLLTTLDDLQKIPYSVILANVVLMMDTVNKSNFSSLEIPKFDNIVQKSTYDDETHVDLPSSVLFSEQSVVAEDDPDFLSQIFENRHVPQSHIAFVMYKNLGNLLPKSYGKGIRVVDGRPVNLNGPIVTLMVREQNKMVHRGPVKLTFKQAVNENRTDPQCVFWQSTPTGRQWSDQGCSMVDRYEVEVKKVNPEDSSDVKVVKQMFVVCSCSHMTSFGLMMDEADSEYVAEAVISLEVISFIGVGLSLFCLFVTFILLMSFKHIQCNSNSIIINLVFVIFITELAFILGVYRAETKLMCRLVAIALHFFHLSGFSWLFIELLHLYRRLIEIREINYGSMKFYYLIGYVVPGIVVGLSVGLYTDGYGTARFCWLDVSEAFIWTFAGPVMIGAISCIIAIALGFHATTREKVHVADISAHRVRIFCGVFLLLLLGATWILGLLSVNYDSKALHYVYAIFIMAQGLFLLLAYVIGDKKVRDQVRKQWYKCQGRDLKSEENLVARGSSVSRSALAYRNDSSYEGNLNRINIGITASSTTSRSTSKNSGGLFKEEIDENGRVKHPNDSDSDSDASEGNISLELASSHSSDEDDDDDDNLPSWEKQLPKNKIVEDAKEQIRKKKKEKEEKDKQILTVSDNPQIYNNNQQQQYNHWPGDPDLAHFHVNESEFRPSDQYTLASLQNTISSVPPDVTLHAQEFQGHRDYIIPPHRMDSLLNDSSSISKVSSGRDRLPSERVKVQVLTHNGSITSDSECSNETPV